MRSNRDASQKLPRLPVQRSQFAHLPVTTQSARRCQHTCRYARCSNFHCSQCKRTSCVSTWLVVFAREAQCRVELPAAGNLSAGTSGFSVCLPGCCKFMSPAKHPGFKLGNLAALPCVPQPAHEAFDSNSTCVRFDQFYHNNLQPQAREHENLHLVLLLVHC